MASNSVALEGLPKQFISSMKTLFEIMDDKKTGFVKLSDLEAFWSEEGLSGLPKGVIESLHKVTPANGLLSFERFVAGLKMCLLRYQADQQKIGTILPQRSPSVPLLNVDNDPAPPLPVAPPPPIHPRSPTATVRPNNAALQHRAISMPQLPEISNGIRERRNGTRSVYGNVPLGRNSQTNLGTVIGPPKPPRVNPHAGPQNLLTNGALMMRTRSEITARPSLMKVAEKTLPVASVTERAIAKAEVRTALQQWQLAQMDSEKNGGTMKAATNATAKRREPRRHTLQSGIDQNMLRRLQVLEQERQLLMNGLKTVERAREWYNSQLAGTQEKIRSLEKSTTNPDYSLEAQQERLGFKMARIKEVNRQLTMLVDNSDRGFPVHMNLALADRNLKSKQLAANVDDNADEEMKRILRRLKDQNHQLTEEVGRKSERITMLEKEKSSLIRELFQVRSQPVNRNTGPASTDDNTFM
nr:EOG090X08VB [Leptodora kindtii]